MLTLGIETSGRAGSIALADGEEIRGERQLSATGRRHARSLVPEIGRLLEQEGLSPREIDVVAVSRGPGSFTGLRVGLVCAKTFAYAAGCRIVGVDTFLAVASGIGAEAAHLWVIDDALRGEVFAGEYRRDGAWRSVSEPRLMSLPDWRQRVGAAVLVSGPGVDKLDDELDGLNLARPLLRAPQAAQVALLGAGQASRGELDDLWTLEPHYIRRSAAEEKADRGGPGRIG